MKFFSHLKVLLCFCVLSACVVYTMGQSSIDSSDIGIHGIYYDSAAFVRWAPLSMTAFERGKSDGYFLERATYSQADTILSQSAFEASLVVLDSLIKPLSQGSWAGVQADTGLKNVAIEIIHNYAYIEPDPDSINVFEAFDEQVGRKNVMTLVSIVADRDWEVAEAMGLGYRDTTIEHGKQYVYILTLLNSGGPDDKFYTLVSAKSEFSLPKPEKPRAAGGDSVAFLSVGITGMDDYYGFYIERSDNMGSSYSPISSVPFVFNDEHEPNVFRAVDSIPSNDQTYIYRVAGASYFGLQGPWSDTVHVTGKPGPLDAPLYISELDVVDNEVGISWVFPQEKESSILGFEVIRSLRREGPFQVLHQGLLGVTTRSFVDEEPLSANYYFIRAIDENGYLLLSLPQYYAPPDTIPPAVPTGLAGTVNNKGLASITWNANSERDIRGYKLYASNSATGLFVEITPGAVADTMYMYKLSTNVLNESWYVKMLATDQHENYSPYSAIVELSRPDVIPPSPPVIKDINVIADGVAMNWILSPSDDVVLEVLQRRGLGTNSWVELLDITNNYTGQQQVEGWEETVRYHYVDTSVVPRKSYSYRILAYDAQDNVSSSVILDATAYDDGFRGIITDLEAVDKSYTVTSTITHVANKDISAIAVGWDYTEPDGLHSFIIYRSADGWPYQTYEAYLVFDGRPNPALLTDDQHMEQASAGLMLPYVFIDKGVESGKSYSYKVMAKHFDGGFSPMSDPVTVTIN